MSTSPNFFCGPGGVSDTPRQLVVELFTAIEKPECEGWFWFRWSRDNHDWQCIEVVQDRGHLWARESNRPGDEHSIENMVGGEWCGPIPMPPK